MKKTVSVILCAVTCFLIFTLCTPVTFAASYNGTCGGGTAWSLDTAGGVLTISGSGAMSDYTLSSAPGWDRYQNYIKSVVFSDGVTSVGAYTFYNGGNGYKYKKLTSVDFGNVGTIGKYAFRGCAFIDTVTSADSVTVIGDYAFLGCSSVTSFPFSAVTTVNNGAFGSCTGLASINLPSTLKKIGSAAFEKCVSASSVTVPSALTSVGDRAFSECTGVTEVVFNSRSLTIVGESVFGGSGTDSGAVLTIADNVGTIPAKMFSYFTGLTAVQGGGIITISQEAFAHTGITDFHVGSNVSNISDTAFADTVLLKAFTVDGNNMYYSADSSGVLLDKAGKKIVRYPGGKTDISYTVPSNITSIAAGAFRESKYLKTFTAGSSVSQIPDYCFTNTPSLTTASLASSVKSVGVSAFAGCKSLSNVSMAGVTAINNYAFTQCEALTSLTTSSNLRTVGDFAYFDCDGLTSVTVTSGTTTIGKYAFYRCDGLHSVSIASTVTTVSEGAFSFCSALSSVSLSENLKTVGDFAFVDCPALLSVKVPASVTTIGKFAFGYKNTDGKTAAKVSGFKLYGYSGSRAQNYATGGGITFEIVTDSDSETVIPLSDGTGTASWLSKITQIPFIVWIFNIFGKIYSFFTELIRG